MMQVSGSEVNEDEPKSYDEATKGGQSKKWRQELSQEYESLIENQTWKLTQLPKKADLIDSKWVYKIKRANGKDDVYKARLVAKGFTQKFLYDYEET